jgi:hypothetical protein
MKLYWPFLFLVSCSNPADRASDTPHGTVSLQEDPAAVIPAIGTTTAPEPVFYKQPGPDGSTMLMEIFNDRIDFHLRGPVKSVQSETGGLQTFDENGMYTGNEWVTVDYTLDTAGKPSETRHTMEGGITTRYAYSYEKDRIIQTAVHNYDPAAGQWQHISTLKYTYDDKGRLVEEEGYVIKDGKEEFSYNTYWGYDENNNVVNHEDVTHNTYNGFNELIEQTFEEYHYTYRYEYDTYGNWIRRWLSLNGGPEFNEDRVITYY